MELRGKLSNFEKEILWITGIGKVWQSAKKLHLNGIFHRLAQIYFIDLLKTSPTYKDVDPLLDPPSAMKNKFFFVVA